MDLATEMLSLSVCGYTAPSITSGILPPAARATRWVDFWSLKTVNNSCPSKHKHSTLGATLVFFNTSLQSLTYLIF